MQYQGNDTITDFNVTQKDTTPQQNDCEKMRYGNTDYYISLQQKQKQKQEKEQHEEEEEDSIHTESSNKP